mmetsp:Transcript_30993/g.70889  ORF Transcript_30993/g.70889 Transcript_30993/m.70889 type:complete len:551 (+) Transcript_30993:1082-2734(+)
MHDPEGMVEMFLLYQNGVEDLAVDPVGVKVDVSHLAADALERGLHAQLLDVGPDVPVDVLGDGVQVDVFVEPHVAGLDLQYLEPSFIVRDAHVELPIEPSRASEGGVQCLRPIGGPDDDHPTGGPQSVHEGEQLAHHPFFGLSPRFLPLGRDGIDLVDEDDGSPVIRGVALGVFEGASEVGLGLAGAFGDDLRSVDDEEVGAGLGGDGTGQGGLSAAGGAGEEDSPGRADAELVPELRVAEGELDQFADGGEVLGGAADGVVTGVFEVVDVRAVDGLALEFDGGVVDDDAGGVAVGLNAVDLHHLKLQGSLGSRNVKRVAAVEAPKLSLEVGTQILVEEQGVLLLVPLFRREPGGFQRVRVGQDEDGLAELHVGSGGEGDLVARPDASIFHRILAHAYGRGGVLVGGSPRHVRVRHGGDGGDGGFAAFAAEVDRVAVEEAQAFHGGFREGHDGVAQTGIAGRVHAEAVLGLRGGEDGGGQVHGGLALFTARAAFGRGRRFRHDLLLLLFRFLGGRFRRASPRRKRNALQKRVSLHHARSEQSGGGAGPGN